MQNSEAINFFDALAMTSYPDTQKEKIGSMIFDIVNDQASTIYLIGKYNNNLRQTENIFLVYHMMPIPVQMRFYNVCLLLYFPTTYPATPPEIYIHNTNNPFIHPDLVNTLIDDTSLKIKTENLLRWNETNTNISDVLKALNEKFTKNFPVYEPAPHNKIKQYKGDCNLDRSKVIPISMEAPRMEPVPIKKLSENSVKELIMKELQVKNLPFILQERKKMKNEEKELLQAKGAYLEQYNKCTTLVNEKNNIILNYSFLMQDAEKHKDEITAEIEKLNLKDGINQNNVDQFIKVCSPEDLKYICMEATVEDMLAAVRKGYEKNVFQLPETIKLIRSFSRELFTIKYCREKLEKK